MNEIEPQPTRLERTVEAALGLWLVACVVGFLGVSLRWPMVGDVTYLHYVVFLMHHGMVPYRQIVDMNLPGAYLLEGAVMAALGPGSAGWRIYDLALMGVATLSMLSILRPRGRLAGVFAAALFLLVHGQDGEIMSGERDFAVAVFLLAAVALLLPRLRSAGGSYGSLFGAGVGAGAGAGAGVGAGIGALLGIAVNVKPTVIPAVLLLLAWAGWRLRSRGTPILPVAASVTAGGLLPCAATLLFLLRNHALGAFVAELRGLIPYHASLAHRSFGFLIGHSISPLLPLCVVWVVALVLLRSNSDPDAERAAIALCAVGGLLSYLLQQKGFAYQRYPFLAFLLVLIAGDFVRLARSRTAARAVGMVGLLAGAVFCTIFLARTATFDRGEPARPLLADLQALGVTQGQVQCMDTAGSCIDNLYAGRIVQSTGFLYDCYLLDGSSPVALDLRRRFWEQIERNPPRWIVVTDSICYDPKPGFDKFGRWPEFSGYLANNYTLARSSGVQRPVRYWSRAVAPFAYRIYVRR